MRTPKTKLKYQNDKTKQRYQSMGVKHLGVKLLVQLSVSKCKKQNKRNKIVECCDAESQQ